jgi:hypothetical protein
MSFSYSGLTNYGKVILPSTSGWGTNNNILRDPPKSIHTRRKTKVGENNNIINDIANSQDRIAESIKVYPRGVNQMVSVSYSNDGNNGGHRSGSMISNGGTSAKLPYRIVHEGAFRPPIQTYEEQFALTRQPRSNTNIDGNPGVADYKKRLIKCGTSKNTKQVKDAMLKASIRPTARYILNESATPTYDVANNISNNSVKSASTKLNGSSNILQTNKEPKLKSILHVSGATNKGIKIQMQNSKVNTDGYINDTEAISSSTKKSTNTNHVRFSDVADKNTGIHITDKDTYSQSTTKSANGNVSYITTDVELNRVLPYHAISTNKSDKTIIKNIRHENTIKTSRNTPLTHMPSQISKLGNTSYMSTTMKLKNTVNPGGIDPCPCKPSFNKDTPLVRLKSNLVNKVR